MDNQDEQYEDLQNPPKRKRTRAVSSTPEEELKKEMHRKCESRRRERINQYYDQLFDLIKNTSTVQTRNNAKMDRCSLVRTTNAYMKELSKTVNLTTRVLCSIVFRKPELIHLLFYSPIS
ncbi:hypothetical protein WA538_001442 [Blastocystis sp. DL]